MEDDYMDHFSHEHRLSLEEIMIGEDHNCRGCGIAIKGQTYACKLPNCSFYLHKLCASAPQHLQSSPESIHPQHPLTLQPCPPYSSSSSSATFFDCNICENRFESGFAYFCSYCKFSVDLRCLSLTSHFIDLGHEDHPLTPWLFPAAPSYICSACGTKHEEESGQGISFLCQKCPFWIHERCLDLSVRVTIDGHPHPLRLAHGMTRNWDGVYRCFICKQDEFDGTYWFYVCLACNLFVHLKCLRRFRFAPKKIEIKTIDCSDDLIHLPVPDLQSILPLLTGFVQQFCKLEKESDSDLHLRHDQHPLQLVDRVQDYVIKTCDACILPISSPPFYKCDHDESCLHKWCADLPKELKEHPIHPEHLLTLFIPSKDSYPFGFFTCKSCWFPVNGFAYKCTECPDYIICVRCSSLPRTILHEAHDHPLSLKLGSLTLTCAGCRVCRYYPDSFLPMFACEDCCFGIHPLCALLPKTIEHRFDEEHPFVLSYPITPASFVNIDEPSAKPFCEFCEKTVELKSGWLYQCLDCNMFGCIGCFAKDLSLFKMIKHGGAYNSSHHREHPLVCVPTADVDGKACDRCGGKGYNGKFGFECGLCEIMLHFHCLAPSEEDS